MPSIIHWKVSHYAAIVEESHGRYHIKDPTFGNDLWVSKAAIDAEASGYFLINNKTLSPGWRQVSLTEAGQIHGMGNTGNNAQDSATKSTDLKAKPGECSRGMCNYNITEMLVSLNLNDTPVGYAPPKGHAVYIKLTYNQRESDKQPANPGWFNVGTKWTLNWLSYIQDSPTVPGDNVLRYVAGGGYVNYSGYNSTTGQFTPETDDGSILVQTSVNPIAYERRLADGSKEVYSESNGATVTPRRVFLKQLVDTAGNAVNLTYDASLRLITITDATAKKTTFSYSHPTNPLLLTKITDPFGRNAVLTYNTNGNLSSITDVIGLTSSFHYSVDSPSFIDSMTTPYGATSFAYGESGSNRWLEATDQLGYKERVEFLAEAPGISDSDASTAVPQGMSTLNQYLVWRNTFYWDKQAYQSANNNGTMDYTKARIKHWLHLGGAPVLTRANTLESTKNPLENRVWYDYPGQPNPINSGLLNKPRHAGQVLDDGTTQLTQNEYNSLGNIAKTIDPVGRETVYEYAANQIDVTAIKQKTSATAYSTIAIYTYNSQHLPLTYIDAAGKITAYAYNANGQIISEKDALGRITSYTYNALGYLTKVTNPNGIASQILTYDSIGRVASRTDSEGYTLSYQYDNFDRLTKITYPDLTTEIITYNKLDKVKFTDRKGRVTAYTYDAVRNLTAVTDPLGGITRYSYYPNQTLKTLTDAKSNITTWNRDLQSRVKEKVYANNTKDVYTYENTTSRLKSIKDARNQTKQYDYFNDDQLKQTTYLSAVNATPNVSFTYDPYFKRVSTMTDGTGITQYQYYPPGVLGALKLKQSDGPYTNDSYGYQYDAVGNITTRTIDNVNETYTYDKLERVTQHNINNSAFVFSSAYLGQTDQLTSLHRKLATGLGEGTDWQYDDNAHDRRLTNIINGTYGKSFSYTSEPDTITSIHESGQTGDELRDWTYDYDVKDRLLNAMITNAASSVIAYRYDLADNLIYWRDSTGVAPISRTYTPNNLNQFTEVSFAFDANGNRTKDDKGRVYEWDGENRLVKISYPTMTTRPTTTIDYDGLGRATVIKTTLGATVTEKRLLWCGDEICQRRNASDVVQKRYHGELDTGVQATGYQIRDHLGSVHGVASAVSSFIYDPYGRFVQVGASNLDFRYAGMYYLEEAALNLTRYRAYDSVSARWLNRDPIAETGGINLYGYVAGDPLRYTDPKGLSPVAGFIHGGEAGTLACGPYCGVAGAIIGGLATKTVGDYIYNHWWNDDGDIPFSKPKRQSRPQPAPKNCPLGTKPVDQMGWPKDKTHKIKDGLRLGPTDWTGVTPDGKIIVTGPDGNAEEAGHESDF